MELAVHLVQGTRQRLVGDRGLWPLAAHDPFDVRHSVRHRRRGFPQRHAQSPDSVLRRAWRDRKGVKGQRAWLNDHRGWQGQSAGRGRFARPHDPSGDLL